MTNDQIAGRKSCRRVEGAIRGRPPGQARARAPAVHARCGHHRDGRRDRLRGDGVEPGESRSVPLPVGAHRYPDLCSQVLSGTRVPTQELPFFGRGSGRIASPAQRERPPTEGRRERVPRARNGGSVLEALSPLTRRAARAGLPLRSASRGEAMRAVRGRMGDLRSSAWTGACSGTSSPRTVRPSPAKAPNMGCVRPVPSSKSPWHSLLQEGSRWSAPSPTRSRRAAASESFSGSRPPLTRSLRTSDGS